MLQLHGPLVEVSSQHQGWEDGVAGRDGWDQVCEAIVAWCIGPCADMFATDMQFGHASAGARKESASSKNTALVEAGPEVPTSLMSRERRSIRCTRN